MLFRARTRRWRGAALACSCVLCLARLGTRYNCEDLSNNEAAVSPKSHVFPNAALDELARKQNQGDLAYRHTLARLRNSNRQRRCGHIRHLAIAGQRAAVAQLRGQPLRSSARRRGQHSACMPTRGQRKHPQEPRKRPPRPQDTTQADGRTLVCYVSAIALVVFLVTKLALGL